MAGKRRSRLDRILPASLDPGPAGGSVTSASPPVPIPEEFPAAGIQLPHLGTVPGLLPVLHPLPELRSLLIPSFSPPLFLTISPQIHHGAGK